MTCIFQILNNTFVGTFLAGLFIAFFGLYLYRRQKQTDIEFEDLRRIREIASVLFSRVQIAIKNYEAQLNLHSGKNKLVSNLYNLSNQKFDNYFKKDFDRSFNTQINDITEATDNLLAILKIDNKFNAEIEKISNNIPTFNFLLLGVSVMHLSKPSEIEDLDRQFHITAEVIATTLQEIIAAQK